MKKALISTALLAVVAFNLFWNIIPQPVEPFDEGRHVASAVEMRRSHEFLVNQYMGQPDYWNSKPPLSFWGAAAGLAVVKNPFLGVRLFSLLASALTILLVFGYALRAGNQRAGLIAALIMATAPAITLLHGARTADPDALFIVCITGALFAFSHLSKRGTALGYALLGLGFLTKGFHAAPYAIAGLAFAAWRLRGTQGGRAQFYLLPLCFLIPVLPWAIARYHADGLQFFEMMFFNDVVRRTTQVVEHHTGPVYEYVVFLLREFGLAVIAAGLCMNVARQKQLFKEPRTVLAMLWLFIPLCAYTAAKSKLDWYVYPLFPVCSILLGLMIDRGLATPSGRSRQAVITLLCISLLFNEIFVAVRLVKRDRPIEDPVLRAITTISIGDRQHRVPVYLESAPVIEPLTVPQDYYATTLLMGNIALQAGGKASFLAHTTSPAIFITRSGDITQR